jgi:hypothetical protein
MTETQEVRITAADYNGRDWDGSPFKWSSPEIAPKWLTDALLAGDLLPDTPNHTDYAEWRVKTPGGEVLASPGDSIVRHEDGTLRVRRYRPS